MSQVIRRLPPDLVNKIAAGEVIERPASVVKELVENSLDAGARRIDVSLEEGGVGLIRVVDDGCGIAPEDLPLAVAPHATSKIATVDDLLAIRTLGFRGEALASIASVSHLRLASRPADRFDGCEIVAGDDRLDGPRFCGMPAGTVVEVRQLFYNVPARRKFLRQPATELSHASEQLARLALAHPGVAFTLVHNGRPSRNLPATTDRRSRIADFFGAELAACLLAVRLDERGLGIEALVAPPVQSRTSTRWQYVFLNGRCIADRRIGFAIREAYRGLVEHDRYPVVFIFLSADPQAFDVNVHPTKLEVRWRDANLVQSQVLAALRETLLSHDLTPALSFARPGAAGGTGGADPDREQRVRQAVADYLKLIDPTQARLAFSPPRYAPERVRLTLRLPQADLRDMAASHDASAPAPTPRPEELARPSADPAAQSPTDSAPPPEFAGAAAPAVMQVHNTYLVAQTDDGVIIVDQHALHERVLYERFRQRILAGPLESQRLLIPPTMEVSARQLQAADASRDLLARLGIELTPLGPTALGVCTFPTLLEHVDAAAFVTDLLDCLADAEAGQSSETLIHKALDLMACRAAVKAGDVLSQEEMQALLLQRHLCDRSSNCPHGRPTTLQITTRELERQFKRV